MIDLSIDSGALNRFIFIKKLYDKNSKTVEYFPSI